MKLTLNHPQHQCLYQAVVWYSTMTWHRKKVTAGWAKTLSTVSVWEWCAVFLQILRSFVSYYTETDDQQIAKNVECRTPCGQRHPQVRVWLVATPPYQATLAECSWSPRHTSQHWRPTMLAVLLAANNNSRHWSPQHTSLQCVGWQKWQPTLSAINLGSCVAGLSESCTSSASWCLLPAWSSACVPRGIVPISHRCRITATSPICHPTAPSLASPPAQLLWPTGFLCGWSQWSVGLEFPAGQLAGSGYWREQFQTIYEVVFVCNVLMHSAH